MPDDEKTLALYRTYDTPMLRYLREAFSRDRADTTDDTTIHFCTGRIALIDQILVEREAS